MMQIDYTDGKNIVYIYNDSGVSAECVLHTMEMFRYQYIVQTINAWQVMHSNWLENALLFVMPGGEDLLYIEKLQGAGNQKIRQYVKNGGFYLGICAGAYYASSYVEFDKGGPLEVLGARELDFFAGKAIGPIIAPYDYHSKSGSRVVEISTVFTKVPKIKVYYNGGGYFENAQNFQNTEVIARYPNKLPAIIKINYGQGKVVLSGVHFEYHHYLLDQHDQYLQEIIVALAEHECYKDALRELLINTG